MIEKFDDSKFVPVPRVPEWPVYEPEQLPTTWKRVAEITDLTYEDEPTYWVLFFDGKMLIFYRHLDTTNRFNGEPIRHIEQYEYPIQAASWFVKNLERFFKAPDDPGGLPAHKFSLNEEYGGERLGISRLIHSVGKDKPGYSLDNLSRCEHPNMDLCQSFKMSDDFLFNGGMLELFKDIASRYELGELDNL